MDEKIEFVIGLVFTITAAASIGAGEFSIFGMDLLEQLHSANGFVLDYATVGSLIAVGTVWFQADSSIGDIDQEYQLAVFAMLSLIVYGSYEPAFASDQGLGIQLVLISISMAGYWALAHEG